MRCRPQAAPVDCRWSAACGSTGLLPANSAGLPCLGGAAWSAGAVCACDILSFRFSLLVFAGGVLPSPEIHEIRCYLICPCSAMPGRSKLVLRARSPFRALCATPPNSPTNRPPHLAFGPYSSQHFAAALALCPTEPPGGAAPFCWHRQSPCCGPWLPCISFTHTH